MTDSPGEASRGGDAMTAARAAAGAELPKRFYKQVSVSETPDGFQVLLDGRPAKTPAKTVYLLPRSGIANDLAAEWEAQGEHIISSRMPLCRLVNSAIDNVARNRDALIDEIAGYADTDLLTYRAESPEHLVASQQAAWDPILERFSSEMSAQFHITTGIAHVPQPRQSLNIIRQQIETSDDFCFAALTSMTNLTGSILLPLAIKNDWIDGEVAWQAAHVDEDWQISQWGPDDEAEARRAFRRQEMMIACRLIAQMQS
jgi:chaperone required for assembly of F1-ATPase